DGHGHAPMLRKRTRIAVDMAREVREEPLRPDEPLPEASALALQVDELPLAETAVEGKHPLADLVDVGFVDPDEVLPPVDGELVGQDAVGVHEDRNAAAAERLVQPVREVPCPSHAEDAVALQHALDVLAPGPPHPLRAWRP